MSETVSARFLSEARGVHRELDAFVVAARFDRDGGTAAFALGDGSLHLVAVADRENWRKVDVHDGAVLALAADAAPGSFTSGGDDGKFLRIGADGAVSAVAGFGSPAPSARSSICSTRRDRS